MHIMITENAVSNSLTAVLAGAGDKIQGTIINGLGERCATNANLISIIPTLFLKKTFKDKFDFKY